MKCRVCGSKIPMGWSFCPTCQTPLESSNPELGKGWTIERIIREWTKPRPIPERVLSAWRTYTPENVIEQILAHRTEIYRRRLETPWIRVEGFAYPLPHLSEIERKPEVFATAIDTDGLIMVRTRHGRDRINRGYKYVYERPKIWFWSETLQLTMKFANMMLAPIRPVKPRPPRRPSIVYVTETEHAPAVMATYLSQPHLIKWRKRANQILKLYKEKPSIRIL